MEEGEVLRGEGARGAGDVGAAEGVEEGVWEGACGAHGGFELCAGWEAECAAGAFEGAVEGQQDGDVAEEAELGVWLVGFGDVVEAVGDEAGGGLDGLVRLDGCLPVRDAEGFEGVEAAGYEGRQWVDVFGGLGGQVGLGEGLVGLDGGFEGCVAACDGVGGHGGEKGGFGICWGGGKAVVRRCDVVGVRQGVLRPGDDCLDGLLGAEGRGEGSTLTVHVSLLIC